MYELYIKYQLVILHLLNYMLHDGLTYKYDLVCFLSYYCCYYLSGFYTNVCNVLISFFFGKCIYRL